MKKQNGYDYGYDYGYGGGDWPNGKLLKMVTQIDGSFGPVAATAAAAADATAPRRHSPAVEVVNLPFFLFSTVLNRFGPF